MTSAQEAEQPGPPRRWAAGSTVTPPARAPSPRQVWAPRKAGRGSGQAAVAWLVSRWATNVLLLQRGEGAQRKGPPGLAPMGPLPPTHTSSQGPPEASGHLWA